jgi:hypothetical protein
MRYYDFTRNWGRKIKPHLSDEEFNKILVRDLNRFTFGRWCERFKEGDLPADFTSTDWLLGWRKNNPRKRMPEYFNYILPFACHWSCNFSLRLAGLAEPGYPWRILQSDEHSTVWNGDDVLFDLGFCGQGISTQECYDRANDRMLKPGAYIRTYLAKHYSEDK